MRRIATMATALALGGVLAACGGDDNANTRSNATNANTARANANAGSMNGVAREGLIDTNVNMPTNLNPGSVPSNTGVVVNNNGNANTRGVSPMNR